MHVAAARCRLSGAAVARSPATLLPTGSCWTSTCCRDMTLHRKMMSVLIYPTRCYLMSAFRSQRCRAQCPRKQECPMYRALCGSAAALLLSTWLAAPAQAQAIRTRVSGVGDDANPCSRTAPCKTYAGAISKKTAGGEISVLDPGGYGTVTITIVITGAGGGGRAGGRGAGGGGGGGGSAAP